MHIPKPRARGTLIKRYKRFLADIRLEDGSTLTAHCPNTGSMRGCSAPGSPVLLSRSDNPKRKYPWTLELVRQDGTWIGVNTAMTNRLVREALENGIIDDFGRIKFIRPEVRTGESRLDFMLETDTGRVYIEVKNCSLVEDGLAMFPDAVTARGIRHLHALDALREQGHATGLIFCIQRNDAERFAPAAAIDPVYAETLYTMEKRGLKILPYRAEVGPEQVRIVEKIPARPPKYSNRKPLTQEKNK